MVGGHDLGIPACSDEDRVDPTRQGRREDVRNLEADEESKSEDEWRVLPIVIVRWLGEEQIQVSKKGAGVCDEDTTE